jgi:DNA topoisomerase-1
MEAAQAKSLNREEFSKPRTFTNKSKGAKAHGRFITDMSLHTVNIDRDQARLYDLIWKRTLRHK